MKLAKQIITLSAALLLCMGVAFTLISGIVVCGQTSNGPERKALKIANTENVRFTKEIHDARIKVVEAKEVTDAYKAEDKAKEVTAAKKLRKDDLRKIDIAFQQSKTALRTGVGMRSVAVADTGVATASVVTVTAGTNVTAKRDRVANAFWYTSARTQVEMGGAIGTVEIGTKQKLTTMGALMVAGIANMFVGAGLVLTVMLLNKREAGEPAPKAKAKVA